MKLALCFIGRIDLHRYELYEKSFKTVKKNVIGNNDCDIFIHGWDNNGKNKDKIIELLQPKDYKIEKIIENNKEKSRWLSHKKSLNILENYNKKSDIYDFVFVCRLDIYFKTSFNFNDYKKEKLYVENWATHEMKDKDIIKKCGFCDLWFFGCQDTMKNFKNIYDEINKSNLKIQDGNHRIVYNYTIFKNIDYVLIKNHKKDSDISRRVL